MLGGCSNAISTFDTTIVNKPIVDSCPMYKKKSLLTNKELVKEYGRLYYLWEICYKKHESIKEFYERQEK